MTTKNKTVKEVLKPVGYNLLIRYLEGCSIGELAIEYSVNSALIQEAIVDTLRDIKDKVKLDASY